MYYIFTKFEKHVVPILNDAIEKGKSIGKKLGVESITISTSVGFTGVSIQISFTAKI